MRVMYKLFESSWRDDAVKLDPLKGIYTDPSLVQEINHQGKFFTVPGPHIVQPSPQRTPLLLQAGTSRAGKQFAAQHAEAIFVSAHSPEVCAKNIAEVRVLARTKFGRDPRNIKVLALVTPILGRTEEEAQAKFKEFRAYASNEGALALFGGWTGIDLNQYDEDEELRHVESNAVRSTVAAYARFSPATSKWTRDTIAEHISIGGNGPVLVGTAQQVADALELWVEEADVDGFNFVSDTDNSNLQTPAECIQAYVLFPQSFKDIIELLLPELQARGLFWEDYAIPSGTYRENFYQQPGQKGPLNEHVAAKYRWRAGQKHHDIPE
jgi:alkanesulfonate monooxygenase